MNFDSHGALPTEPLVERSFLLHTKVSSKAAHLLPHLLNGSIEAMLWLEGGRALRTGSAIRGMREDLQASMP